MADLDMFYIESKMEGGGGGEMLRKGRLGALLDYHPDLVDWTVVDWNHLEENIVKAGSASAFTSALSRSTPPAS